MIRAVLDANVFITAVLTPSGPSAMVLEAWRAERFALLVSPPILEEIARMLAYPKIARRHRWSKQEIAAFVRDLGALAIVTPGQLRLSVIREDPDDDRYLECAVEGRAEYIVSGDRDLLTLGTYRDIAIASPRAFVTREWADADDAQTSYRRQPSTA